MEVSMRDHLLDSAGERGIGGDKMRFYLVQQIIKEYFDNKFETKMRTDELSELDEFAFSLVKELTSFNVKSEKKIRRELDDKVYDFIQKRILRMPSSYQQPPILSLVGPLANIVVDAPFRAIFARVGREFASASSYLALMLALESPHWVKQKLESGELSWRTNPVDEEN